MNWRVLLLTMVLLLGWMPASADAAVLCSNPWGFVLVREHCRAFERPLDTSALGSAQIIFRDVQRDASLAPGESLVAVASCGEGEVVVSGGYVSNPSDNLRVPLNSAFFDGQNSGWRVDFLNAADTAVTISVRVTLSCTKGTGTGE